MSYFNYLPNQSFSQINFLMSLIKQKADSTEQILSCLESVSKFRSTYDLGNLKIYSETGKINKRELLTYPSVNLGQPFNISKLIINDVLII